MEKKSNATPSMEKLLQDIENNPKELNPEAIPAVKLAEIKQIKIAFDSAFKTTHKRDALDVLEDFIVKLPIPIKLLIASGIIVGSVLSANPVIIVAGSACGISFVSHALILNRSRKHRMEKNKLIEDVSKYSSIFESLCFTFVQENQNLHNEVSALSKNVNKLEKTRGKLNKTVKHLKAEASHLKEEIQSMKEIREQLANDLSVQQKLVNRLKKNNIDQEQIIKKLKVTEEKYTATTLKLTELETKYSTINKELTTTEKKFKASLKKLDETGQQLSLSSKKVEQLCVINQTLQRSVDEFSKALVTDEDGRKVFLEKMHQFISDGKKSFHEVIDRISEVEVKYVEVCNKLSQQNAQYKKLLAQQEAQIKRMEVLNTSKYKHQENALHTLFSPVEGQQKVKTESKGIQVTLAAAG
jgi:DNA repair exonuclease SbcCD ATPase subunit